MTNEGQKPVPVDLRYCPDVRKLVGIRTDKRVRQAERGRSFRSDGGAEPPGRVVIRVRG